MGHDAVPSRLDRISRPCGVLRRLLVTWAFLLLAVPLRAAHSDLIVSHTNGVLQVDATLHTGDVRENDASGNGTVWATDNPGFAGSRFRFNDELLFDVTGPLRRWADGRWSTNNVGPEIMEFIEPGPFGDPLNSVTITRSTTLASGYRIAQVGTRGTLHTHFVFLLRTTNGVVPAVGVYSFPLVIRSPQYASAPPVHFIFNNGLDEGDFGRAIDAFQAARDMRLRLVFGGTEAAALSWFTTEGARDQVQAAPAPEGPWTRLGEPVAGDGGEHRIPVGLGAVNRFFRLHRP